jgi:hypothetical protein
MPASPSIPGAAPRAALYSARYEATTVADHGALTIHLDRFATNAPVTEAQLTVEAGAARGPAERLPDGGYRFRHAALDAPGPLALRLQVDEPGQPADVLTGTLLRGGSGPAGAARGAGAPSLPGASDAADPHGHADGSRDAWRRSAPWIAAALALIAAAAAARQLRRARRTRNRPTPAGDDAS